MYINALPLIEIVSGTNTEISDKKHIIVTNKRYNVNANSYGTFLTDGFFITDSEKKYKFDSREWLITERNLFKMFSDYIKSKTILYNINNDYKDGYYR